jgi:hypothetical protein
MLRFGKRVAESGPLAITEEIYLKHLYALP